MSKQIDPDNMDEADKEYVRQRPWLIAEAADYGFDPEELRALVFSDEPPSPPSEPVPSEPFVPAVADSALKPEPEADDEDGDDYDEWTVEDLKTELEAQGQPVTGKKAELIARLRELDAQS